MEGNLPAAPTFPALPSDLIARALEALGSNYTALNGRLVSKNLCNWLCQPHHRTARFNLPLPSSAIDAAWQPHLQRAYRQLPFKQQINTLAAAASSGSEVNLEAAWGLVQPSVSLIGLAHTSIRVTDPGAAAISSGHLHLLPWLVQHGCVDNRCEAILAALEHCSLQEVQGVWELLGCHGVPYGGFSLYRQRQLAEAAARRADPGMAKLPWLLSKLVNPTTQQHTPEVLEGAAAGAAASGNMPMLRWLCGQGLELLLGQGEGLLHPNNSATVYGRVLSCALQHEHVAVVDWLVDEVGCRLPLEQGQQQERELVWRAAGAGGSGEAVRWLLGSGVLVHGAGLVAAAEAGKLETIRLLHEEHGVPLTEQVFRATARSGRMPTATWLLQAGCPMGRGAYLFAAQAGDASMLRWLAREAGCPWDNRTLTGVLLYWPSGAGSMGRLLEATVRELVAAGCPPGGGTDDTDSVGCAARRGHLALVRYLREELGVAFAPGTLARAAEGGWKPVVAWLVGAGCLPGKGTDLNPYIEAGLVGDVDTIACLRRLGVPWGGDVLGCAASRQVPLPSIRWLVEQGAPWNDEAVRLAVRNARARNKFMDTVAWLEERLALRRA